MTSFNDLGVAPFLMDKLSQQRISAPTPIQEEAVPALLDGIDVIAQAQTGTGKTLAFLIPLLQKLNKEKSYVQGLIITPTRELALQITSELEKLVSGDIRVLSVYGGQEVSQQVKKLQGLPHIIIATPGRLLDHLHRETVDLSQVDHVILDEADQMLEIGFLPEVERILSYTPTDRQTSAFSATISPKVNKLAKKYLKNPMRIQVKSEAVTLSEIKQLLYETTDRAKQDTLIQIMKEHRPFLAVIFCRTKRRVSKLYGALKSEGFNVDELHGDLSQAKREKVMKRFREADIQYLVATDVAARGLDVEGVTHVFNYDIPQDPESYIHRIGRTGRAGGKGLAITFAAPKDKQALAMIEKSIDDKLQRRSLQSLSPGKREAEPVSRETRKPKTKRKRR
ncbi:DEAD/DEAH box helicase [Halobacillus sp. Marseille-Q1614]|uniref:DEAD/DEAH box helicase n=1 Tax=Halobacillus sp. Marseille-Q1614 TaxID=2709134 RepID=UPI00156D67AA|nr:DEAD/DEAH box helicase [Halobacillus sp. Marseille-Q1614]